MADSSWWWRRLNEGGLQRCGRQERLPGRWGALGAGSARQLRGEGTQLPEPEGNCLETVPGSGRVPLAPVRCPLQPWQGPEGPRTADTDGAPLVGATIPGAWDRAATGTKTLVATTAGRIAASALFHLVFVLFLEFQYSHVRVLEAHSKSAMFSFIFPSLAVCLGLEKLLLLHLSGQESANFSAKGQVVLFGLCAPRGLSQGFGCALECKGRCANPQTGGRAGSQ